MTWKVLPNLISPFCLVFLALGPGVWAAPLADSLRLPGLDCEQLFIGIEELANPQLTIWELRQVEKELRASELELQLQRSLKSGSIRSMTRLKHAATETYLVRMQNGITAYWHPEGELAAKPGVGTAAYIIDRSIRYNHAPVTVSREIEGRRGSLSVAIREVEFPTRVNNPSFFALWDFLIGKPQRQSSTYLRSRGRLVALGQNKSFADLAVGEYDWNPEKAFGPILARLKKAATPEERKELRNQAINEFADFMFEKPVYEKLKSRSDDKWRETLAPVLAAKDIDRFLDRRQAIIEWTETARRQLGDAIFPAGPRSPLLRARRGGVPAEDDEAQVGRQLPLFP